MRAKKKTGIEKSRENQKLYDILYFVAILAIASILLSYLMSLRPDMSFAQQQVSQHTTAILSALGIHAENYDYIIRIPDTNPEKREIAEKVSIYNFEMARYSKGTELRAHSLHPDNERIVNAYIEEKQKQGLPLYVSRATLIVSNSIIIEVDIIPECVGWIGLFAITSLIVAYPRTPYKKRVIGLFITWPLMYLMNLIRLTTTIYAGYVGGAQVLEFTHDILWKTILIFWALVLWLFWVYFIVEEKKAKDIPQKLRKLLT